MQNLAAGCLCLARLTTTALQHLLTDLSSLKALHTFSGASVLPADGYCHGTAL